MLKKVRPEEEPQGAARALAGGVRRIMCGR